MRKLFIDNLLYLLNETGWTLARLSINSGVSFSTINSMLYINENAPKLETVEKLAKAFGVSVPEILSEDFVQKAEAEKKIEQCQIEALEALERLKQLERNVMELRKAVQDSLAPIRKVV